MVGLGSPQDVAEPRHFARTTPTTPNDFEALVKFELPLQR